MQYNTDSRIYDAIELISLDRESIKKIIQNDVDYYKVNAAKVPFAFRTVYETHLPEYVASLIVKTIQDEINLNPEELLTLKQTLLTSNSVIISYFYT